MLVRDVQSYLSLRRATGFSLTKAGRHLKCFAAYSDAKGQQYVNSQTAIEWGAAGAFGICASPTPGQALHASLALCRPKINTMRYRPPSLVANVNPECLPTFSPDQQIGQIVQLAAQSGQQSLRRQTYSTLFALLSCTGLRVSEAIRLRYRDVTPDGLVIRATKFQKNRLIPLHETAQAGLERYLQQRPSLRSL